MQAGKEKPEEFEAKLVGTVPIPEVVRLDQEVRGDAAFGRSDAFGTYRGAERL